MKTQSDTVPAQESEAPVSVIRKATKKAEQLRRKVCRKAKRMAC